MPNPQTVHSSPANNNGLVQLLSQIPPITRTLLSAIVVLTILNRLTLVPTSLLVFSWYHTFIRLQLWRTFTSFILLPPQAMPALLEMYNIYSRSSQLEMVHFHNRPAVDYLFYLMFSTSTIILSVIVLQIENCFILTSGFVGCLTYTWSIDNSDVKVMFYGLFPIWGKYFPLIQLFMSFVFDDSGTGYSNFLITLIGFSTGYLYSCLDTRSLGPIYGFLSRKGRGYGYINSGQFRAPWWFVNIYDFMFRENNDNSRYRVHVSFGRPSSFNGKGQRLGSTGNANRLGSEESGEIRTAEVGNERNTSRATTGTSTGYFPGRGQRVGSSNNEAQS